MPSEFEILNLVCISLEKANIPYMLTGSFAANFYAIPRMTRDIDIVIELNSLEAEKFIQTFQHDFLVSESALIEAIKYQSMFNIIHQGSIVKIDFIIRKNLAYRIEEFQRKQRVFYNQIPIWIVSFEDLVISKLFWAKESWSNMQIKDIKNLLDCVKNFDSSYIEKWVSILNLSEVYEKAKTAE